MQVVLGLGTNLGNREENLARALDALERLEGTQLLRLSNLYETEPFDVISQQDNYLNCCVLLETKEKPQRLLEHCLEIEKSLPRGFPPAAKCSEIFIRLFPHTKYCVPFSACMTCPVRGRVHERLPRCMRRAQSAGGHRREP